MKNRSLPFAFLLLFSLHMNCGEDSKNDSTLLALLGRNCVSVPKTVRKDDGASTISTYQCSTSGLVYTCSAGGMSYVRTYVSANAAKLGLFDPPESGMPISQRGLASYKLITPMGSVGQHYTYTYDSSQRLVSRKNEMSLGTESFNDYDANGFPKNAGTYSYNYAIGGTRPIEIADGGTITEYNSKGWVTKEDSSSDTFYESTDTLEICD
ncbi:hypothetical protein EHQ81_12325 [Leptospira selangorensis]|uniref:Uncharacterized protein n=1 Tax=Leptospira selangorensis TaxID=2484982 RepID=A0A5F2C6K4_9LEPT|nr:hypothetical protein [Leptospira selangorensis]TGM12673.1 hypothetical protein EHQ81_12325 [Leptospira selangorensis]TGM30734.1 hypothetical protein EHQ82_00165 [Leptospira selangorensis]